MGVQHQPNDPTGEAHRPITVIEAELRDVERHLREVPPHHDGGRAALDATADRLRRELHCARAAHRQQSQQAQQQ